MSYSLIPRKRCKCGCGKYPSFGCQGWAYSCMPPDIAEKVGTKRQLQIKNRNKRKAIQYKVRKEQERVDEVNEKKLWYMARRYEMIGVCQEPGCNNSTNKDSEKYFSWSVAHLVPKSLVPSVRYHSQNWCELCQDHHAEFDSNFDKAAKMGIFPEAKRRFNMFKDLIPPEELRKVNPHLLK